MINARIVLAAATAYAILLVAAGTAATALDDRLGPDAAAYVAMVAEHDVSRGPAATRLSPAFPLAVTMPFALTGRAGLSFVLVNLGAMALLVFAACRILDDAGASPAVRACAAAGLVGSAASVMSLSVAAHPNLLAIALITSAVALSARSHGLVRSGTHAAAALSGPLGVIAPLYGIARAWSGQDRRVWRLAAFVPALAAWSAVQWWARGGVPGLIEALAPARAWADADLWGEPAYGAFAAYFAATSIGGVTVLLWARPKALIRTIRDQPASLALALPVVLYVTMSGAEVARGLALLTPFWIVVLAEWARRDSGTRTALLAGAGLLTLATVIASFPGDVTDYLVTWYPFMVLSGRTSLTVPELWDVWAPRFITIVTGGVVLAAYGRARPITRPGWFRAGSVPAGLRRPAVPRQPTFVAAPDDARWTRAAYVWAAVLGVVTGIFLLGIPVQLSDSFALLLSVQDRSLWQVLAAESGGGGYLRPFLLGTVKMVEEFAGGNYYPWFRGLHALQVLALLVLVVRMLRVRRLTQAAIVPLALAIVVGLHTFAGTVREAFPINTFLTILLCCAAAVNLGQAAPRRANDIAAAALLVFAMLTVESGLLVWVLCVTGYFVGYRGVSRRGITALTALVAAYFVVRFAVLDVGTPALTERSTGFGFSVLDPPDLVRIFGANPLPFYLYNVASGISTVLFAEPRGGTWVFTREALAGTLRPWHLLNVAASTATTAIIARYVLARLADWRRGHFTDDDRIVALFCVLLPANAAFVYAYAKDVIMSPAGLFYAAAAYVAVGALVSGDVSFRVPALRRSVAGLLVGAVAVAWGLKLIGVHYSLRRTAPSIRNEWAYYHEWEDRQGIYLRTPGDRRAWQTLYDDAIWRTPQPPEVVFRWADELFDLTQ